MLEQVETLKGPASVLFGKGTPGGIINAASKLAGPDRGNEIVLDAGTHDRYQAAADFNAQLTDNLYVRLVGLYRESGTQVDYVSDDAAILMPSITWDNGRTRLTAMLEISDRDSGTDSQFLPLEGTACLSGQVTVTPAITCVNATGQRISDDTFHGEPGFDRYDTNSTLVSLLGSHTFSDSFSLDGIFRYKDGSADYRQAWFDFTGAGVPRLDASGNGTRTFYRSDAASEQAAADVRARYAFTTGAFEHEVFIGAAWQDVTTGNRIIYAAGLAPINAANPVYTGTPAPFNDPSNFFDTGDSETRDYGIYINDQISAGPWKVNLGIRYDDTETKTASRTQSDDATSLSAGVLYAFDNGLSPYLSYAESFEPVIGTDGFTSNPLKPQSGEQWEAGLKYQPPGTRTYITFALFDIEQSNMPNPAALIGAPNSQQEGIAKVRGGEIEALTAFGDWSLEGNLSLLDTETPDDVPFDSIAENRASAWLQYAPSAGLFRNFRSGFGVRFLGENESNDVTAATPVRIVTDGVTLADFLIGYSAGDWDLSLNARNITDEEYYGTCLARGDCFPGERRTVVARLARRF